ncbi:hypothetical protein L2E82_29389 [Cichorium intybus]|uniref:Uncharacterized protein n=1 Tax=Cichorium intybus TaxID=13427 RepID=A0ACB9CY67_CICIN|nr:hypothetical protein L2E82_29389 [Cichorium intybus]
MASGTDDSPLTFLGSRHRIGRSNVGGYGSSSRSSMSEHDSHGLYSSRGSYSGGGDGMYSLSYGGDYISSCGGDGGGSGYSSSLYSSRSSLGGGGGGGYMGGGGGSGSYY